MVDYVLSLFNKLFDLSELREAVFEKVEGGQVGVVLFSKKDGNFIDKIKGGDKAEELSFGCSASELTFHDLVIFLNT